PDDVEDRGGRYPDPGDQAVRCADHHLTVRGPCFLRRLAAHEEVEGELVQGVPDRQAVGVGPRLKLGVGVRLEFDPWLSRWLAHTPNATRSGWPAAARPGGGPAGQPGIAGPVRRTRPGCPASGQVSAMIGRVQVNRRLMPPYLAAVSIEV